MMREVVGPRHPDVALVLHNLAALREEQGDVTAARRLYEEALALYRASVGPRHPDTKVCAARLRGLGRAT